MGFFAGLLGDPNERFINKLRPLVNAINDLEPALEASSDADIRASAARLCERRENGESLDQLLPETFAAVREAARRVIGQRHYDEQLMGGIVLHQGSIAEMRTGEGKTLAATLPAALRAVERKGVHIVTVNDYLARRDTVWMGRIYDALGFSVACINGEQKSFRYDPAHRGTVRADVDEEKQEAAVASFRVEYDHLRPVPRREAYEADIVYGTSSEFGFDYLRDNLVYTDDAIVQRRGHWYAIIDEVDSILIDEARTPLIISAPDEQSSVLYQRFARIVPQLQRDAHYVIDEKLRAVTLTEEGIERVETLVGVRNLYTEESVRLVHYLENALRAHALFQRDKDYVVKEGEVILVDEFTGRLMPGRRYSGGLHQAIEAKENVSVQEESRTVASISIQNFFRQYEVLAGMTGTAVTSSEEFEKVYGLGVVSVPTHRPMIRSDETDRIYATESAKFSAVVEEIRERHQRGQPVLVGTVSIERNELLASYLRKVGVPHNILNAKQHEREAEIIAQAGKRGAVTVATNMAGRGVDIILGGNPPSADEAGAVREAGGLHVIGTERHEARRIDDQLRGRAGRQGDPGSSQFFVSLEDEILRRMGGDRIKGLMGRLHVPEDQPIAYSLVSRAIERAQKQVEGYNFDARKHLLEYDDVLNRQREAVYRRRRRIVESKEGDGETGGVLGELLEFLEEEADVLVDAHTAGDPVDWPIAGLSAEVSAIAPVPEELREELTALARAPEKTPDERREEMREMLGTFLTDFYRAKREAMGEENARGAERWVLLRTMDLFWMDHLDAMEYLRDSVRLRAYGQRDPLVEYKKEGLEMFDTFLSAVRSMVVRTIFRVGVSE